MRVSLGCVLVPMILTAFDVGGNRALWENVHWTVATWVMTGLGLWGWRRARGRTRQVRGCLTLGLGSYSVGQLLWDIQWIVGYTAFPAPSDVFYLGIAPFLLLALWLSTREQLARGEEMALYLEASMIFTVLAAVVTALYGGRTGFLTLLQTTILVAYPVIFLGIAGVGLVAALKANLRFEISSPYPLIAGLGFSGVCWVVWNSWALDGVIPPGSLVGYGFSLAHVWVGLGVAVLDFIPSENLLKPGWNQRLIQLLPVLVLPIAVIILVWGRAQNAFLQQWMNISGVGVIILALIRQSLLFWERDRLLMRERLALAQAQQALADRQQAEQARQALLEIMRGGNMVGDLHDFLGLVHRTIDQVIDAKNFFVSLHDKTSGLFNEVYCVDAFDQPAGPHELGKSASAYVFRTGQPLLLSQAQFDALVAQGEVELVGTNSPSWLGVPLKTPTETIGVMVVQNYETADVYTPQDVEFMISIAGQIALVVEQKWAEEALLQFRVLMDESKDAIFLIDMATSQYIDFNKTALEYLGYTREELRQLGVIQIAAHVRSVEDWEARVKLVMENNGLVFETAYQRKEGSWFPVEVSVRTLEYKGQSVMVAVARDITERKMVESALRESENRYRSLVQNLPIGVYRTTPGPQGRFLMANPAFVRMFGYASEEALKKQAVADLYVNPAERQSFSENLIAKGSVTGAELHLKRLDGTTVWSSVTASVVYNTAGEVTHFDCTVEDITERKKANEELTRRAEEFATLYQITRNLQHPWNLPYLLETVVNQAMTLLNASGGSLYLYDPGRGAMRIEVSKGVDVLPGVYLTLGEGVAGRVAQTLQPLVIDDYQQWEGRVSYDHSLPISSVLGVPMLYGGELIGVLIVEHFEKTASPFTDSDIRLLSLLASQAASAVHNARLFEATHRRLAELEAVSRISTALRTTQSQDEMLPLLLDETLAIVNTDTGGIMLYLPAQGGLVLQVARGWFTEVERTPMQVGEGIAGQVFATGEVYHAPKFSADPIAHPIFRQVAPPDWGGVCLPIRTAQEIVGVMFVAVQTPREMPQDEIRLLNTLCEIAGNAIHRTRLYEQTQQSVRRLAALHVIDLAITSSFDLNVSLNVLLEQTLFHLEADAALIMRLTPSLQMLEYAAGRGLYTTIATKTRLHLGESYAGQAALDRRLISFPDLTTAPPLHNATFFNMEAIRAYHCIPLIAKGLVKGVLEVFHRKPFDPDPEWLNFLNTLAGQAAIAMDNAELFSGLQRSNMELMLAYEATIEGWSRALDLRDEETEGHTQRVTETTLRLARAMGLSGEDLIHLRRGALLHDIGKMGIPDKILLKPGALTEEEWEIMRRHPKYAYDMLAPIEYLHPALDIPYCHHEKWDGTGYPRGLKGDQIPLAARLFTIVDIWDALRSNRPYRAAWPEDKVRAYLREQSGKFFDPAVVEVFLAMLQREDEIAP